MTGPQHIEAVVIGASAGGVEALSEILPALPRQYPLPILVVVHLPRGKDSLLAEIFQPRCQLSVKEAEDKEPIQSGTIYFAPPDYHLLVEPTRQMSLSADEPVLYSRPSIDVLFESAADVYRHNLLGIVLSGANSDGQSGLRHVWQTGGYAIVQAPQTALARAMPQAALAGCPGAEALPPPTISDVLRSLHRML